MAGQTPTIVSKREYPFTNLVVSSNQSVVVAKALDVSSYKEATLLVRVHSKDIVANGSIDVIAYSTAPSDEEPQSDFVRASPVLATATISAGTSTTPELLVQSLTGNFGSHVRVEVKGTRGATSGSNLKATLSIDVSLKE
jgi:hypothetical protein